MPMRIYTYEHTPKQFRYRKLLLPVIVGMLTIIGISSLFKKDAQGHLISPLGEVSTVLSAFVEAEKPKGKLHDVVESELEGATGSYGIIIKHLITGEVYTRQADTVYEPASLYKLWIMATTFAQIEEGLFTEDDVLSDSIANLNARFGILPENAELTDGGISQTVRSAMHQMITISHNYAAMLLSTKIRYSNVNAFLQTHGMTHSRVGSDGGDPFTTPEDIALFFEQLYAGKLGTPEHTQAMIDMLKQQTIDRKLPRYLPDYVVMAHKTGELGSVTHDAGIVYTDKGPYIIVVLSDSEGPGGAEERIANISKAVYEYFTQ